MPKTTTSTKDPKVLRALELIESGRSSVRGASEQTGASRSTVRHHLRRRGWSPPSAAPAGSGGAPPITAEGEEVKIERDGSTTVSGRGATIEEVMRNHGMDPEEYVELSVRITDGGTAETPISWVRVNARKKSDMFAIPDLGTFEPRPYVPGPVDGSSYRVAFLADPHCPFIDDATFRACLAFLEDQQPAQVIHLGDAGNHGHIAKHRAHKRYRELTTTTCQSVANYFQDCTNAAPEAQHVFIPGNHDDRIHYYVEDHADEFTGFRPPRIDSDTEDPEELIHFNNFYRLRDLGIELVDQDWKLAKFPLLHELSARHGLFTGPTSERKGLETFGKSQVHGHLHRGELLYRTKHDPLDIRVSMSVPTLARVEEDGLGYKPDPDWTPGMAVADVFEDGKFVLSILPFINNELLVPGGTRYSGEESK